jgi:rfaE bifunctional protein nucleotidyltransferase chain/domain
MIITFDDLSSIRKRHASEKIVLTSGTFDLLHTGHLNYIEAVKEYGDILIVLMSGDNRVKARKGESRPIINEEDRSRMLDGLKKVDYVLIDPSKLGPNETDPIHAEVLKELKPDFYVTDGPDPRFYNLMPREKFVILDRLRPEPSTTDIIKRIQGIG